MDIHDGTVPFSYAPPNVFLPPSDVTPPYVTPSHPPPPPVTTYPEKR